MTVTRLVAVTTRVDVVVERAERRDGLDQRLSRLIVRLGGIPVPLVNEPTAAQQLLERLRPAAVVLSGGNDLQSVGGNAPERDHVERGVLEWATATRTPVVGICRGMQMIAVEAGATLRRTTGHVCERHALRGAVEGDVPSHHSWCIDAAPVGFSVLAEAEDGTCEAFLRKDSLMLGMMWHPERMSPPRPQDVALIKSVLRL